MSRIPRPVLMIGDALALAAFTLLGLLSHDEGITVSGVARTAGPILVGWFAASLAFRTYARPGIRTMVPTWAAGVTVGVVLRTLILHHGFGRTFAQFLGVALGMTLLLLLTWRGIAALVLSLSSIRRQALD